MTDVRMSDRASTLLEVVNRVREMSEGSGLVLSPPQQQHFQMKRDPEDGAGTSQSTEDAESEDQQPLDFSSKKIKSERVAGSPVYGGLLGSDGHSDNSSNTSGNSPHVSPSHHPSNPNMLQPPHHSSTPIPNAATLNLLSVLQKHQQLPPNTPPPYNPLLLAAAASNFVPSNLQANLAELSKVSVESKESYQKFRESMLHKIELSRPKGRRSNSHNNSYNSPGEANNNTPAAATMTTMTTSGGGGLKDDAYWERRKKNNEAAKRSRDARRNKENEVAVRAQFLEQENIQLKMELAQLRSEILNLRDEVYKNNVVVAPGSLESMSTP